MDAEKLLPEVQKKFDFPLKSWKEGDIYFFAPDLSIYQKKDYPPSKFPVFYNPMMTINRDISVILIHAWHEKYPEKILKFGEPLCGIGIRGMRLYKDVPNIEIILNDINELSLNLLRENLKLYNMEEKIKIFNEDANYFMNLFSKPKERFNIIDIDPFGSPVQYIDSAYRAITGNCGLLCVTDTAMPPLVGIYKKAGFRKYGILPLKTEYSHELALRILITFLIREAAKQNIGVNIILSYYHQHHVRAFLETSLGKLKANESLKELGFIYHCFTCNERQVSGLFEDKLTICPSCNSKLESIGPIWTGKLVNDQLIKDINRNIEQFQINNPRKIKKFLNLLEEEKDSPVTFHDISRLIYEKRLKSMKMAEIISALKNAGFAATQTHFSPVGIKTNATRAEISEIIEKNQ